MHLNKSSTKCQPFYPASLCWACLKSVVCHKASYWVSCKSQYWRRLGQLTAARMSPMWWASNWTFNKHVSSSLHGVWKLQAWLHPGDCGNLGCPSQTHLKIKFHNQLFCCQSFLKFVKTMPVSRLCLVQNSWEILFDMQIKKVTPCPWIMH